MISYKLSLPYNEIELLENYLSSNNIKTLIPISNNKFNFNIDIKNNIKSIINQREERIIDDNKKIIIFNKIFFSNLELKTVQNLFNNKLIYKENSDFIFKAQDFIENEIYVKITQRPLDENDFFLVQRQCKIEEVKDELPFNEFLIKMEMRDLEYEVWELEHRYRRLVIDNPPVNTTIEILDNVPIRNKLAKEYVRLRKYKFFIELDKFRIKYNKIGKNIRLCFDDETLHIFELFDLFSEITDNKEKKLEMMNKNLDDEIYYHLDKQIEDNSDIKTSRCSSPERKEYDFNGKSQEEINYLISNIFTEPPKNKIIELKEDNIIDPVNYNDIELDDNNDNIIDPVNNIDLKEDNIIDPVNNIDLKEDNIIDPVNYNDIELDDNNDNIIDPVNNIDLEDSDNESYVTINSDDIDSVNNNDNIIIELESDNENNSTIEQEITTLNNINKNSLEEKKSNKELNKKIKILKEVKGYNNKEINEICKEVETITENNIKENIDLKDLSLQFENVNKELTIIQEEINQKTNKFLDNINIIETEGFDIIVKITNNLINFTNYTEDISLLEEIDNIETIPENNPISKLINDTIEKVQHTSYTIRDEIGRYNRIYKKYKTLSDKISSETKIDYDDCCNTLKIFTSDLQQSLIKNNDLKQIVTHDRIKELEVLLGYLNKNNDYKTLKELETELVKQDAYVIIKIISSKEIILKELVSFNKKVAQELINVKKKITEAKDIAFESIQSLGEIHSLLNKENNTLSEIIETKKKEYNDNLNICNKLDVTLENQTKLLNNKKSNISILERARRLFLTAERNYKSNYFNNMDINYNKAIKDKAYRSEIANILYNYSPESFDDEEEVRIEFKENEKEMEEKAQIEFVEKNYLNETFKNKIYDQSKLNHFFEGKMKYSIVPLLKDSKNTDITKYRELWIKNINNQRCINSEWKKELEKEFDKNVDSIDHDLYNNIGYERIENISNKCYRMNRNIKPMEVMVYDILFNKIKEDNCMIIANTKIKHLHKMICKFYTDLYTIRKGNKLKRYILRKNEDYDLYEYMYISKLEMEEIIKDRFEYILKCIFNLKSYWADTRYIEPLHHYLIALNNLKREYHWKRMIKNIISFTFNNEMKEYYIAKEGDGDLFISKERSIKSVESFIKEKLVKSDKEENKISTSELYNNYLKYYREKEELFEYKKIISNKGRNNFMSIINSYFTTIFSKGKKYIKNAILIAS